MSEKRARNYEIKCLLELIAAIINDQDLPRWNRQPQWGNLYKAADYHEVANMVYYALLGMEGDRAAQWKPRFEERYRQAVLSEERYSAAIPELLQMLEEYKIHCMVLQEYRMCSYYPQRDMRALKSVKILAEKGKGDKLREALALLDYEKKESRIEGEEWYYKIPGIRISIMTSLPFTNKKMQKYFAIPIKKFAREQGRKYVHAFSPEEYYLHVIGMAAEKYARGNLGIRDMTDLWLYYIEVYKELDWKTVNGELDHLKLEKFHVHLMQLAAYWFGGMLFPENDSVFEAMEKYIFTKGVQGRKLSSTLLPLVKEVADFYKKDLRQKRRKQIIDWMFPERDYMDTMFPVLRKASVFLPVCWVLRLLRMGERQITSYVREKASICCEVVRGFLRPKKKAVQEWMAPKQDGISSKIRGFRDHGFGFAEDIRMKLNGWVQKLTRKT